MNKPYVKKALAVAVILLFFSVSVIPSTGTTVEKKSIVATLDGNTLYVGGNGTGNYSKIQDAINDSTNGDTVYVYDDSSPYYENVVIGYTKSINLVGEDRNTTVIDAGGKDRDVVYVSADWVNISGFTIQNSGGGDGIRINSKYNTISDNTISSNNEDGIYVSSNYNTLTDNTISSNNENGIHFFWSSNNTLTGNTISSNNEYDGIYLYCSSNNTLTDNTISSNNFNGIFLLRSSNNTLTGNTISSNNYHGIYLDYSSNNAITGNDIRYSRDGICLQYYSSSNTITGNNISNNEQGIGLVESSSNNTFLKNNFLNNKRHAFFRGCRENTWKQNYWNRPRILPKIIFGSIGDEDFLMIPWINIDWHPAKEPYDI